MNNITYNYAWAPSKPVCYFLPPKLKPLLNKYDRLRSVAKKITLSKDACNRLEWIIWYHTKGNKNVSLTSRHFGIAPKTFYKWFNRFDETNLSTLESISRAPVKKRVKEFTPLQYERVVKLRKQYIRYGKMKLLYIYNNLYPNDTNISAWKIQCIIQKANIYYHPVKQARINKKRQRSVKRKKISDLKKKKVSGFLLCVDTIVKYHKSKKRYIITAIDKYSKLAFARMYTTHSSQNSQDFLCRMYYLLDGKIKNVQTDNGSEFKGYFSKTLKQLNIPHYHSRVKTPKDNPDNERFNRTLQEEFIQLGNMTDNTILFNQRLTEWLVEYNFKRPHQTLGYVPPVNFHFKHHKVLPMYPSSTCP